MTKAIEKVGMQSSVQEVLTLAEISEKIAQLSNYGMPRVDFLRAALELLLQSLDCDAVEVRLKEQEKCSRSILMRKPREFKHEVLSCIRCNESYGELCDLAVNSQNYLPKAGKGSNLFYVTKKGSFVTGNFETFISKFPQMKNRSYFSSLIPTTNFKSVAIVYIHIGSIHIGQFSFWDRRDNLFLRDRVKDYENVASTIGLSLTNQSTQAALRERLKELDCLYSVMKVATASETPLSEMLAQITGLLPPAFQYPDVAAARIIFDNEVFTTPGFDEKKDKISCNIVVNQQRRGEISVCYTEVKPATDTGQFLDEERNLLEAVAREVAIIIERKTAADERARTEEQLRHADRLATIGQLAAGVAHELNEPLGGVLGFAQLLKKAPELPTQQRKDVEKIEAAALHAREVIKKLMLFSRQTAPTKVPVNLNEVIENGLYFLQSRCAKIGIQIELLLEKNLPEIVADPSQLHQVLVNLVVNSIQAMPKGGKLTIKTLSGRDTVTLIVKDTGTGMSEETKKRVFLPFFTTKRIGEGTGLGLPVVHGIVASHGGKIELESKIGVGTTFAIHLPLGSQKHSEEKAKDAAIRKERKHPSC